MQNTVILVTYAFYLVLLLGIGIWSDRRFGRTYKGFLAADKSLGGWVTAISASASSESAWVMLGLSGLGYSKGLAAYWAALGCALGFLFTAIFIVVQLHRDSEALGAITVSDYIELKLHDRSKMLRVISALLIFIFMMVYVVAQFIGSGKQMSGMHLMTYSDGVLMGAVIIGIYVVLGGYAAVCWTDLVQGLLMALVMIVFPIIAFIKLGGISPVIANIHQTGQGLFVGGAPFSWLSIGFITGQLAIGLGYPGMPHSILRYITVKEDREAKKAAIITVVWGMVVLFGSATLGIAGRVLLPGLKDPETILPAFTAQYFHPVIAGIVLAAITAAIMSTADSQLMISATAIVHDLFYQLKKGGNRVSEKRKIMYSRLIIGIMTLVAMLIALPKPKLIYTLVLFAWGALGAAFAPVIILSLYWKRFNRWGALASFISGPITIVLWKIFKLDRHIYELVPGFAVSMFFAWIVTILTKRQMK